MKRALLILGTLFIIIFCSLLLVDRSLYGDYLAQKITKLARAQGVRLAFNSPELRGVGLSAKELDLFLTRQFLEFNFTEARLKTKILPLLRKKGALNFNANGYGGLWQAELEQDLKSNELKGNVLIDNVKISSHPQLQAFNLSNGQLHLKSHDFHFANGVPVSGDLEISLSSLNAVEPIVLSQQLTGLPMSIQIPAFKNLNLSSKTNVADGLIKISEVTLDSSLGSASGSGTIDANTSRGNKLNLALNISLSKTAMKEFGDWLPLISNNKISNSTSSFNLKIRGTTASPQFLFQSSNPV